MEQQYEDEIDLVDYIKVVYKRWKMIVILVFVSMLFAGILSLSKPKVYKSSATFFTRNTREYYDLQSTMPASDSSVNINDMIISILESRTMADRIIEQLELKKKWGAQSLFDAQKKLKGISKITLGKNNIVQLTVITGSPQLSADIANAYVDNIDYFNREFGLGAEKNLIQVLDRAIVSERRMSRDTKKNVLLAGIASFIFAVFLAFFLEFIKKSNIIKRLREE